MDSKSILELQVPVWDRAAASYEQAFRKQTENLVAGLLAALDLKSGERLLDIATGSGFVAAAAADAGVVATGVDISPEMIRQAKRLHPGIDFEVADAAGLPYPDAVFDAVASNLGLFLVADPGRALAEIRRVLKPGRRFAHTLWDEGRPGHALFYEAVTAHGGKPADLGAPPLVNVVAHDELAKVMTDAGFTDVDVQKIANAWVLEDPAHLFDAFRPMADFDDLTVEVEQAIRRQLWESAEQYRAGDHFEIPFPALMVSGTR